MKRTVLLAAVILSGIVSAVVFTKPASDRMAYDHKDYIAKADALEENTSFVIVIPSYNNRRWCERNLRSVFEQEYSNYRVLYIDDASSDGTGDKVKEIVKSAGQEGRFTLISNPQNAGALQNLYHAVHSCKDNEVVVVLDGDDWLAHEKVLKRLNLAYSDPKTWLTYGSYVVYPTYKKGECARKARKKEMKDNTFRVKSGRGFTFSHLRTFYAGLFKQISLQDLLHQGSFMKASGDMATMYPMIEMAGAHGQFIKEKLYIYNTVNPLNDDKVHLEMQQACEAIIRDRPAYARLDHIPQQTKALSADLVVFSYDRPLQLYAFLESHKKWVKNCAQTAVVYRCSTEGFDEAYELLKQDFPDVVFLKQSNLPAGDFKALTMQAAFEGPSDYVIFAVDDIIIKDEIDFCRCAQALEATQAYGFYLRLGKHLTQCYTTNTEQDVPPLIRLPNGLLAWQFAQGEYDWNYPQCLDMTLYKKSDIYPRLQKIPFENPNSMEGNWARKKPSKQVGICFEESKIVNIPLNLINEAMQNRHMGLYTTEDLLAKFKEGLKIDIKPFKGLRNLAAHEEVKPQFVPRKESAALDKELYY